MPQEEIQVLMQGSITILQLLGATSVVSFLSLYAAWLIFPPELVIESVANKSKKFSSESRIKIKNNGKLPAIEIQANVKNVCAVIGTNRVSNCEVSILNLVTRLSGGESAEIAISPGFVVSGMTLTQFTYVLTLKYHAKLFFFRKDFKKAWKVELRNFEDGFDWHIVPV